MSPEKQGTNKWAPWWVYLIVILGCNYVKQYLVRDLPVAVNALITVVLAGALFLVITAIYRGLKGADRQRH
ncbi:hypothetical protein [Actinoplanes sp. TFC3]|uniref:hypothetical protein n=1 Tax=Actinoplanes sp. TFC3 TaxID=1710355 RepID=UPI0008324975|nr:hypothetical protein [Actinoplanes sp. TFC3]